MAASNLHTIARDALLEITEASTIGDLTSEAVADDGVVTLQFAATMPGYPGWHWTVGLVELPGEEATVLEAELMPGEGALLAPDWVPWSERLDDYRAAQVALAAAALEGEGEVDVDDDNDDDDDDDDDEIDDEEEDDDDDDDDEPDDGIDFEGLLGDELDVPAVGVEQADES